MAITATHILIHCYVCHWRQNWTEKHRGIWERIERSLREIRESLEFDERENYAGDWESRENAKAWICVLFVVSWNIYNVNSIIPSKSRRVGGNAYRNFVCHLNLYRIRVNNMIHNFDRKLDHYIDEPDLTYGTEFLLLVILILLILW